MSKPPGARTTLAPNRSPRILEVRRGILEHVNGRHLSFGLPNNSLRIVYASGQHSYNVAHVLDYLHAVHCSRPILDGFCTAIRRDFQGVLPLSMELLASVRFAPLCRAAAHHSRAQKITHRYHALNIEGSSDEGTSAHVPGLVKSCRVRCADRLGGFATPYFQDLPSRSAQRTLQERCSATNLGT